MAITIGIDASRAFLKRRTGIEEYSYQVIRHLRAELAAERVVLYIRSGQTVDFDLPATWEIRALWMPRLWTQLRLSWELLWHRPDVLLVPAHTVPVIHPKRTVVVVHGLEYEFCPQAYSWWERWYMRVSIWASVRWASRVVCVSENTRRDVMNLYSVSAEKITVIGEGYVGVVSSRPPSQDPGFIELNVAQPNAMQPGSRVKPGMTIQNFIPDTPYFLFIGRIEERKNVARIIKAFDVFKEKTELPYRLVLAGKPGYGYERVESARLEAKSCEDILELGYVSEEEKWELLRGAEAFVFPSLYEGFGIPVLEAQSVGTAVIAASTSSLPEVAGDGAVLVDPERVEAIVAALEQVVSDKTLKSAIIQKGKENIKRFSWEQCARELAVVLRGK